MKPLKNFLLRTANSSWLSEPRGSLKCRETELRTTIKTAANRHCSNILEA